MQTEVWTSSGSTKGLEQKNNLPFAGLCILRREVMRLEEFNVLNSYRKWQVVSLHCESAIRTKWGWEKSLTWAGRAPDKNTTAQKVQVRKQHALYQWRHFTLWNELQRQDWIHNSWCHQIQPGCPPRRSDWNQAVLCQTWVKHRGEGVIVRDPKVLELRRESPALPCSH